MQIPSFPSGSQVVVPFTFTTRTLTAEEWTTYEAGGGLPPGVGLDPEVVTVPYWEPEESAGKTVSGAGVTRVTTGVYRAVLLGVKIGMWTWRGVGETSAKAPVAATVDQMFQITQSRSV